MIVYTTIAVYAEALAAASAEVTERVSVTFDGANIGPAVRLVRVDRKGARRRFTFAVIN